MRAVGRMDAMADQRFIQALGYNTLFITASHIFSKRMLGNTLQLPSMSYV
jgi:hypothetical protein